ncbi:MAG: hypothetical protein ACJAXU_001421 [Paracoccaceae bacterium]|jgi:hypothetical protein
MFTLTVQNVAPEFCTFGAGKKDKTWETAYARRGCADT